jgi:hypothetical protein
MGVGLEILLFLFSSLQQRLSTDWLFSEFHKYGVSKRAIIFSHHKTDAFTKWSFDNVKHFNKGWDFIPMGFHDSLLSELRTGTVVRRFTDIKRGRPDVNDFINWRRFPMNFSVPHYYHPVKEIS